MNDVLQALANKNYQLLDVTLRDGGYLNNWGLDDDTVLAVVDFLLELPVMIELGYASDMNKYRTNGTLSPSFLAKVRERSGARGRLVLMLFQEEPNPIEVLQKRLGYFDLVRIPVRSDNVKENSDLFTFCRAQGLAFSINFTRASAYSVAELIEAVAQVQEFQPTMIYFADSRGAMLPGEVETLYRQLAVSFPGHVFGFHAHNNLSLALINSAAAVFQDARFVDASLLGMGLGGGNLGLEQLLFLIHEKLRPGKVDLVEVIARHQHVYTLLSLDGQRLKFMLTGARNQAQESAVNINNLQDLENKKC